MKTQVKPKLLSRAEVTAIARQKLYEEYYTWVADNKGCHINALNKRTEQLHMELNRLNGRR